MRRGGVAENAATGRLVLVLAPLRAGQKCEGGDPGHGGYDGAWSGGDAYIVTAPAVENMGTGPSGTTPAL